jgi:hypothetical protein
MAARPRLWCSAFHSGRRGDSGEGRMCATSHCGGGGGGGGRGVLSHTARRAGQGWRGSKGPSLPSPPTPPHLHSRHDHQCDADGLVSRARAARVAGRAQLEEGDGEARGEESQARVLAHHVLRGGEGPARGGSFGISETCPGERSYVGVLRVAGARATRRGGVEPRARTDDAQRLLGPSGGRPRANGKLYAECHFTGKKQPQRKACPLPSW